jgi:exodeoxyribonuclease-3
MPSTIAPIPPPPLFSVVISTSPGTDATSSTSGKWRGRFTIFEAEHAALDNVLAFGLTNSFREIHQKGELFSWWYYQMGAFRRNRGLGIDYVFASEPIVRNLKNASIDFEPRRWEQPSDVAPPLMDFALEAD